MLCKPITSQLSGSKIISEALIYSPSLLGITLRSATLFARLFCCRRDFFFKTFHNAIGD